ncbi:MAG: hypothetical protein SFW62_00525 [Alphaproteobacteria bacterium]|nr:hypothetical protein [Alphaproteobacteria bacterium]
MLGILCGLESEAAIARRIPGACVACAGARPDKARALARDLVGQGVKQLISFGIAGGLKPGLPIGALVIGTQVTSFTGAWNCDAAWGEAMARKLPQVQRGGVWGSESLIAKARDKQALYAERNCLIVDMESQCAAEIAAETGVPLTVVRAVCDVAELDVPPLVMKAIAEDGRIHVPRAAWEVLKNPLQIPTLLHVSRSTNHALAVLEQSLHAF